MSPQHDHKGILRAKQLAALQGIDPERGAEGSLQIRHRLETLDALLSARRILAFAPLATEPDISPLLESLRQEGRTVLLPRMGPEPGHLDAVTLTEPLEELERDRMGIRVPSSDQLMPPEEIDLVLVPGVAFDRWGQRLGRGGGHYDRLLGRVSRAHLVGVCFELAMCEEIPVEPHDRRVDRIVTEHQTIDCPDPSLPRK